MCVCGGVFIDATVGGTIPFSRDPELYKGGEMELRTSKRVCLHALSSLCSWQWLGCDQLFNVAGALTSLLWWIVT